MQALGLVLMVTGTAMFAAVAVHRLLVRYGFMEPLRRTSPRRMLRTALRYGLLGSTCIFLVGAAVFLLAPRPTDSVADRAAPGGPEHASGTTDPAALLTRARDASSTPGLPNAHRVEILLAMARLEAALGRPDEARAHVIEAGDLCSDGGRSACIAAVTLTLGRLQAAHGTAAGGETLAAAASLYRAAGMGEWAAVASAESLIAADGKAPAEMLHSPPPPLHDAMPEQSRRTEAASPPNLPPPIVLAPPPVPPTMRPSMPPAAPAATSQGDVVPPPPVPEEPTATPAPAERETPVAASVPVPAPAPTQSAIRPPPVPKPAPGEPPPSPGVRSAPVPTPTPVPAPGEPGVSAGPPRITAITAPAPGRYPAGSNLNVVLTFDRPVAISGIPLLHLGFDSGTAVAVLLPSNSDRHAIFRYGVAPGDVDRDGIDILSPVVLNGGGVVGVDGTPALLEFNPPDTSGVLIGPAGGAAAPASGTSDPPPPAAEAPPASSGAGSNDTGPYWVQLAAMRTEEAAEAEWQRLARQQQAVLGGVGHDVRRIVTAAGIALYRLRSGPFDDPERARQVCRVLATNGIACFVGGT